MNKHNIGPKLYSCNEEHVEMEYIDGTLITDYIGQESKRNIKKVFKEVLAQCRTLDKLSINKYEMHHPIKHIIIRNNKPIMIDFERCKKTIKPKNVTQFCEFIIRHFPELEDLRELTKAYSKEQTEKNFREIYNRI